MQQQMHKLNWYLNRLRAMSLPEMVHRAALLADAQAEAMLLRAPRRSTTPAPDEQETVAFVSTPPVLDPAPYLSAADEILDGHLELLFEKVNVGFPPDWNRNPVTGETVPLQPGKTIDYRDSRLVGNIKYLWVLNRHHQTLRLAQAYALSGQQRYLDGVGTLLESWVAQCPYPFGPNWTSSLELAIRLMNWSVAWYLIGAGGSPLFADPAGVRRKHLWLSAIYHHLAFISGHFSRYSSANNHLIGEAAGLFIGSAVWPYWHETKTWRSRSRAILEREVETQTTGDGVDREHSTFYQSFVLEFLMTAGLVGNLNGREFSEEFWRRVALMLEFPAALMDVGGNVPQIGDSDDAFVLPLGATRPPSVHHATLTAGARLLARPHLLARVGECCDGAAWLVSPRELQKPVALSEPRRSFAEAGYYVLGERLGGDREVRIVANATPLGYLSIAAHGHADALAFTLSIAGEPFLIDPGTYAYQGEQPWRGYFRGTSAHNTCRVDGLDQARAGGNFLWLTAVRSQCRLWYSSGTGDELVACHDGYLRLRDPLLHTRRLHYVRPHRRLFVEDTLECRRDHHVERFWHFAPHIEVTIDGRTVHARGRRAALVLTVTDAQETTLHRGEEAPPLGWISPRFGERLPTTVVRCANRITGATTLTATLHVVDAAGVSTD